MSEHIEDAKNKLNKIESIRRDLKSIKSKKFTNDENALYQNFKRNVDSYAKLVKTTISSGNVSIEDMENIQIIEKKILQDARATILEDGKVTEEEVALLTKLIEFFEKLT